MSLSGSGNPLWGTPQHRTCPTHRRISRQPFLLILCGTARVPPKGLLRTLLMKRPHPKRRLRRWGVDARAIETGWLKQLSSLPSEWVTCSSPPQLRSLLPPIRLSRKPWPTAWPSRCSVGFGAIETHFPSMKELSRTTVSAYCAWQDYSLDAQFD